MPFGTIPWSNPHHENQISFLRNHILTKITGSEYTLYSVDPTYKFKTDVDCVKFQKIFRDRELIASFHAVVVQERVAADRGVLRRRQIVKKEVLCRRQIVKIWRRSQDTERLITMTFLMSSRGPSLRSAQPNEPPNIPHAEISLGSLNLEFGTVHELDGFPAVELVNNGTESSLPGNLVISFERFRANEEGELGETETRTVTQVKRAY